MRINLLLSLLLCCFCLTAQERFSRIKIRLDDAHTLAALAQMGLDVDHGKYHPGKSFTGEFAESEHAAISAAGFQTEVLIEDLQAHLQALNRNGLPLQERTLPPCPVNEYDWQTPANYAPGSMGGYFTYQEMLDILDQMATMYPNIFKAKTPLSSVTTTIEGRPVFWVKVSDNPNENEPEPEILYNAVHHAREPNSMSALIFYLWHLLENYETDPEIKYLVDNTEMYFVPCVNPDGYIYNETTNPDGGGLWRKNRRVNADGTFGVDLNRNYGFHWGFDNTGSSPNPNSQTYRGTAGFSEPETQMMRDFCAAHQFKIALNGHTYGNLLIYPWGFSDAETVDHPTFSAFGNWMTRENHYTTGLGSQTVGYTVNGDSDDWMYGDSTTKARIFSMTPEAGPGDFGFWPPSDAIDELNKATMLMNLTAAHLLLNYGIVKPSIGRFITEYANLETFSLQKLGLGNGALVVSLEPVSDNIANVGNAITYGMFHLESINGSISYTLKTDVQNGDSIRYNILINNGLYTWSYPVTKIFNQAVSTVFTEAGDNTSLWTSTGAWAATTAAFYSAPSSITDSPGNNYPPNVNTSIEMTSPIKVKNASALFLTFWTKWNTEEDYDYAQVSASIDGGPYQALCGKYTEPGVATQGTDEPVYDGGQAEWVLEEIDLSDYLAIDDSIEISIRFSIFADNAQQADGFFFDDLAISVVGLDGATSTFDLDAENFLLTHRPNPAGEYFTIDLAKEISPADEVWLRVFNAFGQEVAAQKVSGNSVRFNTAQWQTGAYFYSLSQNGTVRQGKRFVVIH